MSGVRNLRAMFEQQKGDSLPDRGRSPGPGGFATPSPSASPRPLSKVRTSFVAVEKDGRIGLRREPSRDSVSVSSRRLSDETDTTTPQPTSDRADIFSDNMANPTAAFKTNLSREAIPESPGQDTIAEDPTNGIKSQPLEPNANPDKITDEEEPQTKLLPGNPTELSATRLGGTLNGGNGKAPGTAPSTTVGTKAPNTAKSTSKTVAPVSTARTTIRAQKSPMTTKGPAAKESAKVSSSATNSKPTASTGTKSVASKPTPIDLPPPATGFVKPKPKSPTRPVKLPSSLTTHTASSAQKLGNGNAAPAPRQSLSRASGNLQHLSVNPTTHRPLSRNSVSNISATTTKTLKHRQSTANIGRSRPSLGPPPKPTAKDQALPKKESHVDEGFLARMMRPTQSSAKKTSEKVPVTPPRKQSVPVKKLDTKDAEKSAQKAAAKIQASAQPKTSKGSAKPAAVKENTSTSDITPNVAQAKSVEPVSQDVKPSVDTASVPAVQDEIPEAQPVITDTVPAPIQEDATNHNVESTAVSANNAIPADLPSAEEPEATESPIVPEPAASTEIDAAEPTAPVPAVSEDPLLVADIESVIQEVEAPIHEPKSDEPATDVSQPEPLTEAWESSEPLLGEPKADADRIVDESSKDEGKASEAPETEGVSNTVSSTGGSNVDEEIIKDATAGTA